MDKDKLIEKLEEYINLLGKEINDTASIAIAHGWQSHRVEEGEKLREEIQILKGKDELKTSEKWQEENPSPKVLDPDGWDRKNFNFSWFEEKITYTEYLNRVMVSTCEFQIKK